MTSGTKPRTQKVVAVGSLLTEDQITTYGYLLLPVGVMQQAGSATQTVAGIRSHWGRCTFADPRTIAVAACLDESTVRRRHLPKLFRMEWVMHRMVESRNGHRREYFFNKPMARAFFDKKSATLPRWAALLLPEWSYRAVYATVLQKSLATSRGSQNDPVKFDPEDVLCGNAGRHNFSLSYLADRTGLTRESAADAKHYLIDHHWLQWDSTGRKGSELFINLELGIPQATLQQAHQTTRAMMFGKKRRARNAA